MASFLTSCLSINKRSTEERYIKSNNVNVRSESQKNSSVIFQLDKGDRVEIGTTKNGYTEILKDGIHQGFVHDKLLSFFSDIDICKSGISKIFGRQPNIMNGEQYGDSIYISYIRSDGKVWTYMCLIRGNQIMWGVEKGRLRIGPYDEKIFFTIKGNKITVTEGGSSKTFYKNEF